MTYGAAAGGGGGNFGDADRYGAALYSGEVGRYAPYVGDVGW